MTGRDGSDMASTTPSEPRIVRVEDLSRLIRAKRKADGLTLEQVASQTGLSAATLSRLERQRVATRGGRRVAAPDTRTLAALTRWLGVSIERVIDRGDEVVDVAARRADESTPDVVEAHLRADRNLDADTAAALGRMFRTAYERFAELSATTRE